MKKYIVNSPNKDLEQKAKEKKKPVNDAQIDNNDNQTSDEELEKELKE